LTEEIMTTLFQLLPVDGLRESPTNPRKTLGDLSELVESVRTKGVLQPVLVRPANGAGAYELVFGHRRLAAARKAGLEEIPAIVREMDDREVLEAQIVENCQRADIHHLEEADGYRQLHEKHGYAIEDLAAKVGKSKAYVYARMKLCALVKPARKAFLEGKLNPSTALLIARIPVPKLQEEATRDVAGSKGREPMGFRLAAEHIQSRFMLQLSGAGFRTTDEQLVPEAGSCRACPKRTGNQRELFDDVKSADVCTDPECFARKREAAWAARVTEAEARGQKVLSAGQCKNEFPWGDRLRYGSPWVSLDSSCEEDPKRRTWRRLLGKHAPQIALARPLPERGRAVELVQKTAARKALREAGHDFKRSSSTASENRYQSEQRAREKKAQTERAVRLEIFKAIRLRLEDVSGPNVSGPAKLTREDLHALVKAFCREEHAESLRQLVKLLGWEPLKRNSYPDWSATVVTRTAKLDAGELTRFLITISLAPSLEVSTWSNTKPTELLEAAKRYGVSADRIRREVLAKARAKEKKKPAPSRKKKASAKKTARTKTPRRKP
jgi:ParB/RepB/Spo0J family partition protein